MKKLQKKIFLDKLKNSDKFVWFCEIENNFENKLWFLKDKIVLSIDDVIEDVFILKLSEIDNNKINNIEENKLIINLDVEDDDKLLTLNLLREELFNNFDKVLIVSKNKEISNRFISVSDDLFSWIQNHLEY